MATARGKKAAGGPMSLPASVKQGAVLGGRWRLGKQLGKGACATVFEAEPMNAGDASFPIVAKVVPVPPPAASKKKKPTEAMAIADTLYFENVLYTNVLGNMQFSPRVPLRCYGEENGVRFLVMERLGVDLESSTARLRGNPAAVAEVGLQMVEAMAQLHNAKHIFVDVKPANFMHGQGRDANKVYLVDFGLAQKYITYAGTHKEFKTQKLEGTPDYASVFMHEGATPSRRDDIIGVGYVLLFLLVGPLPWHGATSNEDSLRTKKTADLGTFAQGVSGGNLLAEFVAHAQTLGFEDQPDYGFYTRLLQQLSRAPAASSRGRSSSSARGKKKATQPSSDDDEDVASDLEESKSQTMSRRKAEPKKRAAPQRKTSAKRQQTSKSQPVVEVEDPEHSEEDSDDDDASDTIENTSTISGEDVESDPEPPMKAAPRGRKPAAKGTTTKRAARSKTQSQASNEEIVDLTAPIPAVTGLGSSTTAMRRRQKPQVIPPTPVREYTEDTPSIDHLEGIDEDVEQLDLEATDPTVISPLGCGLLLKCVEGPHAGEIFPVPSSRTIRIGRTASGRYDIQLPRDEYTSEAHLSVAYMARDNTLRLRELGSTNHTKIIYGANTTTYLEERNAQAKVGVGDQFRIGETYFLVVPQLH